jgi:hypothetical protein
MNRDIDRTDMHRNNPLDFMFGQVGKGNIITEQKRQATVVVLEV